MSVMAALREAASILSGSRRMARSSLITAPDGFAWHPLYTVRR